MSGFSKVRAICVKELRESLRDRRTVFANLIIPVLLYPVMMFVLSSAVEVARAKREGDRYRIAIEPPEEAAFFTYLASREPGPAESPTPGKPAPDRPVPGEDEPAPAPRLSFEAVPDAENALKNRRIQALVRLPYGFRESLESRAPASDSPVVPEVEIRFDRAEHRSQDALLQLRALLNRYRDDLVKRRLQARNLDERFIQPFRIKEPVSVATAEKVGGSAFGTFLPLMFMLMIITGAVYPAIDLTAGEKERFTLETLIAAPVRPLEVIAGKFLAVAALSLTNAFLNILSFALTFYAVGMEKLPEFRVPWSALPATLLLLLPLTLFFAALLMAVASFAASFKEAQVYCIPVYLVPMLGLMVSTIPGIELSGPLLVAPVINTALLIKELLLGHEELGQAYFFVLVSTTFYAVAAIALAARVFAREEVLFSAQGSLKLLLNRRFFRPQPRPTPADALLLAALLFPVFFYVSTALGQAVLSSGADVLGRLLGLVLLPQVLVFLLLPLAATWYLRLDLRETFLWRWPSPRALAAGVLLGGSSWVLAQQGMHWQSLAWPYVPPPEFKLLDEWLKQVPPLLGLALIALTPALCEEHFFRGFFLSGFRKSRGKTAAILLAGVIFGLFHFSLYRLPLTGLLGIVLGYLAWESRSLLPGVLFHLLHNGLPLLLSLADELPPDGVLPVPEQVRILPAPDPVWVLPALLAFVAGLWLARGSVKKLETAGGTG